MASAASRDSPKAQAVNAASTPNKSIDQATDSRKCLLSLDGGGVRGLSTLYILKKLMKTLNDYRRDAGLPAVQPYDVFDIIAGTSTGG